MFTELLFFLIQRFQIKQFIACWPCLVQNHLDLGQGFRQEPLQEGTSEGVYKAISVSPLGHAPVSWRYWQRKLLNSTVSGVAALHLCPQSKDFCVLRWGSSALHRGSRTSELLCERIFSKLETLCLEMVPWPFLVGEGQLECSSFIQGHMKCKLLTWCTDVD